MIQLSGKTQGINFENKLTWKQIQAVAQKYNKMILVDCYADWCMPCQEMDNKTFSEKKVGDRVNSNFISLKIQMDDTKIDSLKIKSHYNDVRNLIKIYNIKTYPTVLFFSPLGALVHKSIGFKEPDDFLDIISNARTPDNQYYTLIELYRKGKKEGKFIKRLAIMAKEMGDTDLAYEIASAYIDKLQDDQLYTKDNVLFIADFTRRSKDRGFGLFYYHWDKVIGFIENKKFRDDLIDRIIASEEIQPNIKDAKLKGNKPNWNSIMENVTRKYNKTFAERSILKVKLGLYFGKDRKEFANSIYYYTVKYEDTTNFKTPISIKTICTNAWYIFEGSTDRGQLSSALSWMKKIIKDNPNASNIDTYANLLYKLGNKDAAIIWQEKAAKIDPSDKEVEIALMKMKKNENTWPDELIQK